MSDEDLRASAAESLLGTVISGRYRIEKLLGEGGMGAVYQAEHTHMRKRLAVKVLHADMSRLPEVVARFEREAMAAAHIDHPNVATATDFGKLENGSFFLVLEFVEGMSLRDAIAQGPLEVGRTMRIVRQIAAALQRAHALGIVHRDLKPENVMLVDRDGQQDFVKVLDFGIAKVPVAELSRDEENKSGPGGQALTQLGMVYGTPEYMAPEQALGQNVTPSADIYALGVMAYEMLAGERPFDHESKVTLLGMHVTAPVPPFSQKAPNVIVPREVEGIVLHMLEKEAASRYKDAKELMDAIDGIWLAAYGAVPAATPGSTSSPRASLVSPRELTSSHPDAAEVSRNVHPTETAHDGMPWLRRDPKRLLFVGLGALALLAVIALASILTLSKKRDADVAEADAGAPAASEEAKPEPPVDPRIPAAIALVKGSPEQAIEALIAVEKEHPERADIHIALEKAYSTTKNRHEAMHEAELALDADPAMAIDDQEFDEDIHDAAIGRDKGLSDQAFALMEKKMKSAGPDLLYIIGYLSPPSSRQVTERARGSLQQSQVLSLASPALAVTMDLRNAGSCDKKRLLLQHAGQAGDERTLALLRSYSVVSRCGFLGSRTCANWPCLFKDGALARTIGELEARTNRPASDKPNP